MLATRLIQFGGPKINTGCKIFWVWKEHFRRRSCRYVLDVENDRLKDRGCAANSDHRSLRIQTIETIVDECVSNLTHLFKVNATIEIINRPT